MAFFFRHEAHTGGIHGVGERVSFFLLSCACLIEKNEAIPPHGKRGLFAHAPWGRAVPTILTLI